jgi:hypothetical protein
MSRPTAVVLLCEDHATAVFLRLYVKQCSITRNIRVNITPSGCGFDWVLQQYPVEIKAYRIARAKKSTWLIAAIDADKGTVTRRLRQFSLHQQNAEDKHVREFDIQREKIALLVPRRNIETWLLFLSSLPAQDGQPINEIKDYKKIEKRSKDEWIELAGSASVQMHQWVKPSASLPGNCIESVRLAITQLQHLQE